MRDKKVTYTDKRGQQHTVTLDKANDYHRGLERDVRNARLEIAGKTAAESEGGAVDIAESRRRLTKARRAVADFCKETGIRRQEYRERIGV